MSREMLVEVDVEQVLHTPTMPTVATVVVETRDLKVAYPMGRVEVQALKGVNLEVHKGELISVMGPSGCGKSTLLHVIGGLLTPTHGSVSIDGEDLTRMSDGKRTDLRRNKIGFVFQRFNLFPTLTVEGNLKLAQRIHAHREASSAGQATRRDEILRAVGLEKKKCHKPAELSGGEQQRVALARAVINRPSLLLADEPTGNLDSENSNVVLEVLETLNQNYGQTIVMITHDPWVASYSDRIMHMKDGRADD